jgi:hypothetical protein
MPRGSQWAELWRGVGSGVRDDTATKLAGRLLARGIHEEETLEILMNWNMRNEPPLPEKDLTRVVNSIDRAEFKKHLEGDRKITTEVKEWALVTSGEFTVTNVYQDLGLVSVSDKNTARQALVRMEQEGLLAKCGLKRGCYRTIEKEAPLIDFVSADISQNYPIKWPFGLEYLVNIYPKNVIIIAGSPNAGKTCFLLNTVRQNMFNHPRIEYFSSEMGAEEMKLRLSKFDNIDINEWKFFPRERASNFADAVVPDALNIIDYLEITKDFYEVGGEIKSIFDRLGKGIAIIAIQKKTGQDVGRGGEFTLEKPRLYLSMDGGSLKILKAKNWAQPGHNPNDKVFKFKIVNGCKFVDVREVY